MIENLKNKKGITLVSLVITIVILIILAGISINATLGENGIITIAKRAKENIELAKIEEETSLNELYEQMEQEDSSVISYDTIASVLKSFKKKIAEAIREKGVETSDDDTAEIMADNIRSIKTETEETEETTATSDKILKDYTAYSNGQLITGTMTNNGAVSATLNAGESYTIPAGYHNGSGIVTANSLASQTSSSNFILFYGSVGANASSYFPIYLFDSNSSDYSVSNNVVTFKKSVTYNFYASIGKTGGNTGSLYMLKNGSEVNTLKKPSGAYLCENLAGTIYFSEGDTLALQTGSSMIVGVIGSCLFVKN